MTFYIVYVQFGIAGWALGFVSYSVHEIWYPIYPNTKYSEEEKKRNVNNELEVWVLKILQDDVNSGSCLYNVHYLLIKSLLRFYPEDFSRGVAWLQLQRPDPIKNCLVRVFASLQRK